MSAEVRERLFRHGRFTWLLRELESSRHDVPPAVFVPGLGSGEYLLPHARLLAETRPVFVPDMPGFGASRGPRRLRSVAEFGDALLELLDWLGTEPVDLLGNSFGTQLALAAAATRPEAVRRLVLIGPTFDAAARHYPRMLLRWLSIAPVEPPALALSLARSYAKCGVRTPALAFRAAMRDRPEDRIAEIEHPVLLVRGSRDRIAPLSWLHALRARAATAEIVEIPGVAHTVDFAAPERLSTVTRAFLDRRGESFSGQGPGQRREWRRTSELREQAVRGN